MSSKAKIIFFGTPLFAAKTLTYLLDHQVHIVAIVTQPDRPRGRSGALQPQAVKALALEKKLEVPVLQPEKASAPEFIEQLKPYSADLFVVVAYGEILRQALLDLPPLGCINVHPSLLPKYRGAAPIQRCLMQGDRVTGVSIIEMVRQMDAGDLLNQAEYPVGENVSFGELEAQLCELGCRLLLQTIEQLTEGKVERVAQEHGLATLAPKIELADCELHWAKPAVQLHNLVRATNPYPGAWCWLTVRGVKMRLKVWASRYEPDRSGSPGELLEYSKAGILVAAGQGALRLLTVQLEGKKSLPVAQLVAGYPMESMSFKNDL